MTVQDPKNRNEVDSIFYQTRRSGALLRPSQYQPPLSSSGSFTGTGRLLSSETAPTTMQQPESIVHNIVFWGNGFTVDDGPLRRLDDPENFPFLEGIKRSQCPKELESVDRKTDVHVHLSRRIEDYIDPEENKVSFRGAGRTLGSSSTTVTYTSTAHPPPIVSNRQPSMGLVVDRSQPSTSIQLRLSDGTRIVAHFNHHHKVADIRAFNEASRLGGSRTYQLQAVGFPPKILTDLTQTIEQAGLLNSMVIQKG